MTRGELLRALATRIDGLRPPHPARIGIDGVDAAGKTTLADELAGPVEAQGRTVIRASIDDFHNPKAIRYRAGRQSPEGYFRDSFDLPRLRAQLLDPLGSGGSLRHHRRAFDYRTDQRVVSPEEVAPRDAILLFDGVFLQRPELAGCFELTLFLDVPFEVTAIRMAERDGAPPEHEYPENRRYVEGQRIYLESCRPKERADLLIDNADPSTPRILRGA